jgi:hypothetical protein
VEGEMKINTEGEEDDEGRKYTLLIPLTSQ